MSKNTRTIEVREEVYYRFQAPLEIDTEEKAEEWLCNLAKPHLTAEYCEVSERTIDIEETKEDATHENKS